MGKVKEQLLEAEEQMRYEQMCEEMEIDPVKENMSVDEVYSAYEEYCRVQELMYKMDKDD